MIINTMTTLKDRLEEALKESKVTKTAIWKACGLSSGAVSQWFSGATQKIEGENLLNAARVLGVNPDWLASGKGKMKSNAVNQELVEYSNAINLPLLNITASMGNGDSNHDEVVVDVLRVKKEWVDKTFSNISSVNNLSFIHAIGDSMMPTFNDGDILLVDSGVKDVTSDSVYVLEAHERLFIKRVRRRLDGAFEISSDNPSVKTVDILNGDHQVIIKGKVVWVWNGRKV